MSHSIDWSKIRHFKPSEFDYPDLIKDSTILMLDSMREHEKGIIITINSDYRPGDPGYHGKGMAVDCVIRNTQTKDPLPIIKQFIMASRYFWSAIGFYPYWNEPGLHLDTRPMTRFARRATWWRDRDGRDHSILTWT